MNDFASGHSAAAFARDFTIPGAEPQYPPDLVLEPVHLDIALRLDFAARAADCRVLTRVSAGAPGGRRLVLEARGFEDLAVTDPAGRPLDFLYDGRTIEVSFAEPVPRGETREIVTTYRVVHPLSGLHFGEPAPGAADVAPWAATDHETERARYWLPCVDYPAVRTTLAFALRIPATMTAIANGRPAGEEVHGDGTKTVRYVLEQPCPSYLVCFAAGDFVRFDDAPVDGRPVAYFADRSRATSADLARSFDRTPAMLRWMEKRLGVPYPYPKYWQFGLPHIGGAMENISLVSWDDVFVLDEDAARESTALVDLVNVHEMAHSWFGDAVVIRDFAHAWLKESWATCMEGVWLEEERGADEAAYHRFLQARAYMDETDSVYSRPIVTRVFNSSWDMYDRHLYPGGAWRIHMLRRLLGDEVFWPAVRDYLDTYSGRTVETEDFRRVLEAHSGRSLVRFFDQWIHGRGYPRLRVSFTHDAEKKTGSFTIEQVRAADEKPGEASPPPFSFPLTIAWETAPGIFERRSIAIERSRHVLVTPLEAAPLSFRADPDGDLLARVEWNPGDAPLRRALRHAPDPVGRILAAEELAKTATPANLAAVVQAYDAEAFWGVRREIARVLAESRTAAGVAALARFLGSERDPRVAAAVADRAGEFRDPAIAEALRAYLDRGPPPRAAAAALRALGRQRDPADLPRLVEESRREAFRGLRRAGALRGLAEFGSEEALRVLRDRPAEGIDTAHVLPEALARAARPLSRRHREAVTEDLVALLRDPRERVRTGAARALADLRAVSAAAAVEAVLATLPEQNRPRVARILRALRNADGGPEDAKMRKSLDALEERCRRLEERIDRLEAEKEGRP